MAWRVSKEFLFLVRYYETFSVKSESFKRSFFSSNSCFVGLVYKNIIYFKEFSNERLVERCEDISKIFIEETLKNSITIAFEPKQKQVKFLIDILEKSSLAIESFERFLIVIFCIYSHNNLTCNSKEKKKKNN